MTAILICPSAEEWPIIEQFLKRCEAGALVISPDIRAAIDAKYSQQLLDNVGVTQLSDMEVVDYDFGGLPDTVIDFPLTVPTLERLADGTWVDHTDGIQALLNQLGLGPSE